MLGNIEMGSSTPPAVFARCCFLGLSLVSINGTHPGWPALLVLWRSKKLDRFVNRFKRWPVFSTRDSYAARKVGESSGQRWSILCIINVWPVYYNKASNFEEKKKKKKLQKQSCTPNTSVFYWCFTCFMLWEILPLKEKKKGFVFFPAACIGGVCVCVCGGGERNEIMLFQFGEKVV